MNSPRVFSKVYKVMMVRMIATNQQMWMHAGTDIAAILCMQLAECMIAVVVQSGMLGRLKPTSMANFRILEGIIV